MQWSSSPNSAAHWDVSSYDVLSELRMLRGTSTGAITITTGPIAMPRSAEADAEFVDSFERIGVDTEADSWSRRRGSRSRGFGSSPSKPTLKACSGQKRARADGTAGILGISGNVVCVTYRI
jgi:hypothetical protein